MDKGYTHNKIPCTKCLVLQILGNESFNTWKKITALQNLVYNKSSSSQIFFQLISLLFNN